MTSWHRTGQILPRLSDLTVDEPTMPPEVENWLSRAALLHGVPFNHLVPDPRMLPAESIRFFWLDPDWTGALLDGALSIGRVTSKDQAHDRSLAELLRNLASSHDFSAGPLPGVETAVTGFLLRSALVSGWPRLEVAAFADAAGQTALKPLRLEHLSDQVMIGLFDGLFERLDLREPGEGIHFGADYDDAEDTYTKSMVRGLGYDGQDNAGQEFRTDAFPIKMRSGSSRVVNFQATAGQLASELEGQSLWNDDPLDSAQIAVQMVESPAQQKFIND